MRLNPIMTPLSSPLDRPSGIPLSPSYLYLTPFTESSRELFAKSFKVSYQLACILMLVLDLTLELCV